MRPRTHWITALAGLGLLGEPVDRGVVELGVGLEPVVEERRTQPVDGRPPHAEMRVAPFVLVAGVAVPLVGDADPAGEPGLLVDDHHLAVGPMVHLSSAAADGAAGTNGPAHLRPAIMSMRLAVDRPGSPGVEQDANADARSRSLGERLGELGPDLAAPIHEREEVDRVLGPVDGLQHRREDLVPVPEHLDAVPLGRRARR